ncbi:MAG: transglycosylase domain-containing protein [Ruminococcus sp.]|nr:transglycosylase domain-containing protein [Ruminococcus sp.]MBQ7133949.1 transglycosylase domain-containing protein [Ruminococcus sp.]
MRKTDISKYTDKIEVTKKTASASTVFSGLWKVVKTLLAILVCAGIIVSISLGIYAVKLATEPTGIDLNARSLNLSSFIYIEDPDSGEFVEYQKLYGTENRIWVDLQDMPEYMGEAIIAIEDKRFYDHHGVDWVRTGGAVLSLLSGSDNYGGSTLTQQLIKNLTDDNEVSLTRKLREIFRALNIENDYSKDDILEAYLNVVNFGNNAQGVQAAAELYFNKDIGDCTMCECAAIAGITQNPAKWNPLIYPENNKIRRELVLDQMYEQERITKEEYDAAIKESETLEFVDYSDNNDDDDEDEDDNIQNWYIDQMYGDLVRDLAKYYDISENAASEKLYTEGLKIYCAMDLEAQEMIEYEGLHMNDDYGSSLQVGMTMVGFDGRVIATTGSSQEKDANLLFDRASDAVLQPGSAIKPMFVYPIALETDTINYSGLVLDEPVEKYRYNDQGVLVSGPNNAYGSYNGYMTMPEAISWSSNAGTVQTLKLIGTETAYNQAVNVMGFKHLDPEVDPYSLGALSLGGMSGGVTVREMAAGIAYVGNGGLFYEPYTYYYVTDANGTVILDNRNNMPTEAYSPEVAYEMNRALRYNVLTSTHSHSQNANVSGWEIVGKTGTTDDDKDSWFVGASPYCTLAVWTGYDTPDRVYPTSLATTVWRTVMGNYLENKEYKEFDMPGDIITATYCKGSGLLASSFCGSTGTGYYTKDTMPDYCGGYHVAYAGSYNSSATTAPSEDSSDTDSTTGEGDETTGTDPSEGGSGEEPTDTGEETPTAPPEEPPIAGIVQ